MFHMREAYRDFSQQEKRIFEYWDQYKVRQRFLKESGGEGTKSFVLFDGPPFATGKPHYGHLLSTVIKDVVPRYKRMMGYKVVCQNGWDCHGLPVEHEVERELSVAGKQEIEKMGVENFNKACRQLVVNYRSEWQGVLERMGRWADYEKSYSTMDQSYMQSVWWVFSQLWKEGLVYRDLKSTWYCPRCGTPLSNFEVNQGYKDYVEDPSVFVKFQLDKDVQTYLLVWTTSPWTLPGNSAVGIHPDLDYVKIKLKIRGSGVVEQESDLTQNEIDAVGQYFILATDRLPVIEQPYDIVKTYKGKDLLGIAYRPLYSFFSRGDNDYVVVAADFISQQEGTGLVHIAPAFGEDDFAVGQEYGLPLHRPIDEHGRVVEEVNQWAGKFFKDVDPLIVDELQRRSLIYKDEKIYHTYPFCWRCDTPLMYYTIKTWFIGVSEFRNSLVEHNNEVKWLPSYVGQGRFGNWIVKAKDWNVSRNRFWGTPLPIWECVDCAEVICVESLKQLRELASAASLKRLEKVDFHRPFIDDIHLICPKCQRAIKRVDEVFDCWFESGCMPYASQGFPFANRKKTLELMPADLVVEGIDQTRGWFYTLQVISTLLRDEPIYRQVMVTGTGLDQEGVKLSKKLGNYPALEEVVDRQGADALRWYFLSSAHLGEDWRFSQELVTEKFRKVLMTWWNSYVFFLTYTVADKWGPGKSGEDGFTNVLDCFIISRLHHTIGEVKAAMDSYDLAKALVFLEEFIQDISGWYIRRSRKRFRGLEGESQKVSGYRALYEVLFTLSKLMAPFTPFVAEEMFLNLSGGSQGQSVHLESYPSQVASLLTPDLEQEFALVRELVEHVRAMRAEVGIRVRQPLGMLYIAAKEERHISKEVLDILLDEVNVKSLTPVEDIPVGIMYRELKDVFVGIDTTITLELQQEGLARELIRSIQQARKEAELSVEDEVSVYLFSDEQVLVDMLDVWKKQVCEEVGCERFKVGNMKEYEVYTTRRVSDYEGDVDLDGVGGKLCVSRIERRK